MKYVVVLFVAFSVTLTSCGKNSVPATPDDTPTNLVVTAVVNPDNSGNVTFSSTATNAVTYAYNFGNGIFQANVTGPVTYKYPASGTYTVNSTAKSSSGKTSTTSIQVTVSVELSLVWSDEFNTDGAPDPTKWGYDLGAGGWGNNESQNYTNRRENSIVQGGSLKINLVKESYSGSPFTSARLLSKDKYSFQYGRAEIRAKLPAGGGTWPAIWMLGSNISSTPWPACGEIDIMEHLGNDLNKIYATLHYPGRFGGNADGNSRVISNATTEFHKYSLEWSPTSIKMLVDDLLIHSVTNTSGLPFNQNFFFILNIAMGGNFGGVIDPAVTAATMEIDYIRVYQ